MIRAYSYVDLLTKLCRDSKHGKLSLLKVDVDRLIMRIDSHSLFDTERQQVVDTNYELRIRQGQSVQFWDDLVMENMYAQILRHGNRYFEDHGPTMRSVPKVVATFNYQLEPECWYFVSYQQGHGWFQPLMYDVFTQRFDP